MSVTFRAPVLHLFSNFKWTGPAEPALDLAVLQQSLGVPVTFRSSAYTKDSPHNFVRDKGRERGLEPVLDLELSKHRSFVRNRRDARRLVQILERERPAVVHAHLPNALRVAMAALARFEGPQPAFVCSYYETQRERLKRDELDLMRSCEQVFVYARSMLEHLAAKGFPPDQLTLLSPSIDLGRFDRGPHREERRAALGFAPEHFVAGIVARVQPHRNFDLLLDAASRVAQVHPHFRLVIIGRGSKLERTALLPARQAGLLEETLHFPGYLEGEDYVDMLRALDAKIFLVPGTDGTARAVREALAVGLPVVSTRRGILAELVCHEHNGLHVDETPESLAQAIVHLIENPDLRAALAQEAHADARVRFDRKRQVQDVLTVYERLTASARPLRFLKRRKRSLST